MMDSTSNGPNAHDYEIWPGASSSPALQQLLTELEEAVKKGGEIPPHLQTVACMLSPAYFTEHCSQGLWTLFPFLEILNWYLMEVMAGRIKRLMVFTPPRHGKSTFLSHHFPAFYLGTNPDHRIILASHTDRFASDWGRKVRNVIDEFGPQIFGIQVDHRLSARADWEILGRRGGMITAGIGGTITGRGADLGIIDDPVSGAKDASSPTIRRDTIDWWNSDFYTRLHPGAAVILIQTRWHDMDLAGYLLSMMRKGEEEEWVIVNMPALCEDPEKIPPHLRMPDPTSRVSCVQLTAPQIQYKRSRREEARGSVDTYTFSGDTPEPPSHEAQGTTPVPGTSTPDPSTDGTVHGGQITNNPLDAPELRTSAPGYGLWSHQPVCPIPPYRNPGEALCPERYPREYLLQIARKDPATFFALYQQRPTNPAGNIVQRHHFNYYTPYTLSQIRFTDMCFSLDSNFKKTDEQSYCALGCWGLHAGNLYLLAQYRERVGFHELMLHIRGMIKHFPMCRVFLIEEKANGDAIIDELRHDREVGSLAVVPITPTSSKEARAQARAKHFILGQVFVPDPSHHPWVEDFITEWVDFPNAANDDQVDQTTQAFDYLAPMAMTEFENDAAKLLDESLGYGSILQHLDPSNPSQTVRIGHAIDRHDLSTFSGPQGSFHGISRRPGRWHPNQPGGWAPEGLMGEPI